MDRKRVIVFAIFALCTNVCAQDLIITEVDYDQPGTDSHEWVEIYNSTPVEIPTAGLSLVLYNGDLSGNCNVYCTVDLAGLGSFIPEDTYIVIGNIACASLPLCSSTDAIQNGSPDAVALIWRGNVIDSVEYDSDLEHTVCNFNRTMARDSDTVEGSILTFWTSNPPTRTWSFSTTSTPCAPNNHTAADVPPQSPRASWGMVKSLYH